LYQTTTAHAAHTDNFSLRSITHYNKARQRDYNNRLLAEGIEDGSLPRPLAAYHVIQGTTRVKRSRQYSPEFATQLRSDIQQLELRRKVILSKLERIRTAPAGTPHSERDSLRAQLARFDDQITTTTTAHSLTQSN
jgi:hypothetical protein